MTRKHRYIRAISGVLIAALFIYFSYHEWKGPSTTQEVMEAPKVIVTTSPVMVEDVPLIINVFGSLRALDSAMITTEINGTITEIFFNEGDSVEKDAPLIQIDNASEKAEVAKAKAQLELNTVEYKRRANLLTKQAISQQEVDQSKANLDISQAELDIAKTNLEITLIKAPFAGILGAKKISVGQYVSVAEPLLEIVDRKHLKLEYSVSEQYLSQIALGQMVELTTSAYPTDIFTGTVNFVAPSIDPSTRTLAVEAVLDNSDGRLSPGLSVKLTHILGYHKNGFKIPEESLLPTVEGYRVYVIKDNIATSVPVEIESRVKGFVYIAQGLNPDDVVVTTGQEKLRDGATVEILSQEE